MADTKPEAWLRGAIDGYDPLVMPIVHSLIQAREDVEQLIGRVPAERVWTMPGAASIGFHVRHLGGALDRLCTYARGEALSEAQKAALRAETQPGDPPATLAELSRDLDVTIDRALAQLKPLTREALLQPRTVGRAALRLPPSACCSTPPSTAPATRGRRSPRQRCWTHDREPEGQAGLRREASASRCFVARSFCRARLSICRTRSRVTDRCRPISSSVYSRSVPRP